MTATTEDAPTSTSLIDACGWYGHRPPVRRPASGPLVEPEAYDFVF